MKINLDWQKRSIILFAFIVLIFSVILTIFAIREAEREKMESEREINQEQRRIASSVNTRVTKRIRETEDLFSKLLRPDQKSPEKTEWAELSIKIKQNDPLVDEIFYVDPTGEIRFPLSKPLYRLDEVPEYVNKGQMEVELNPLFMSAETAEFKMTNYSLAISYYRQLLRSLSTGSSRAFLLNRIARCYKSAGRPESAIQTYKQIVSDYSDEISPEGIPFALMALYQLGTLNFEKDKNEEGVEAFLDLYHALIKPQWSISRAQFNYYLKKVREELDSRIQRTNLENVQADIAGRWAELEKDAGEKSVRMDAIETISQKIDGVYAEKKRNSANVSDAFFHFSGNTGDEPLLISYTMPDGDLMYGFSMDCGYFKRDILPAVLTEISSRDGLMIRISDEGEECIAGEGISLEENPDTQLSYTQGFEDNFPPWNIQIFQAVPSMAFREFNLRRNIYISLVAVVIVALLFGGVLAIRSTAKELKLARLKSDFVATVSHEFRTPLTSIRYLADLLQRGRVRKEERKQQYYETITHESERLSRLIENILDFSKIEAGMKEYEFEEVDVAEICRNVAPRFQEQAGPQQFTIKSKIPEELPRILADREALSRALFNLLDNAMKYSGESRKIIMRGWEDESNIFIEVEDEGVGIAREELQRIFEKFYRSSAVHEGSIKGSGIGLTIVDHIVKAHGGEVVLESELGKGTKVRLRFPKDHSSLK